MSNKTHACGYTFPRMLEVATVPAHALDPLKQVILRVECPRCQASVDLTVVLRDVSDGKVREVLS